MGPALGTLAIALIIGGLFWLDRGNTKVTNAMWVPYIWLLIASSRPLSNWLSFSEPNEAGAAYVDGSPLDRNVLTLFLFLALVFLYKRAEIVKTILAANPAILVYFCYCLISIVWSDYPFVLFKRWIRSVGDIAVVLLIITEPSWVDSLKWLVKRIAFVLVPISILLIRCYPSLGRAYSRGGVPEWTGVSTDKNALGMLCMIYGASLLWHGITMYKSRASRYRKRQLLATAIALTMVLYLLLVVNSQTALACFVMADILIIMTSLGPSFRRPAFVSLLVVGMLTASFCVLFLGIGGGALTAIGRDASLTGRTDVWKTVLPYAKSAWVGAGYENFWVGERMDLFERLLGGLNQAHNGYIEIYLNLGWIGLILLGILIAGGYRRILNGLQYNPELTGLKLALFLICLIYNFTEASFKMQSPVWILFLLVIMAPRPRSANREITAKHQDEHSVEDSSPTAPGVPHWART